MTGRYVKFERVHTASTEYGNKKYLHQHKSFLTNNNRKYVCWIWKDMYIARCNTTVYGVLKQNIQLYPSSLNDNVNTLS